MTQQAASGVPEKATQGAEARRRGQWWWTEASIWTERMVSALGNGVKGGKWYSLMDKSLPQAKAGDRIVQTALKMVIEPIPRVRPLAGPRTCFETQFRPGSYGFRPGRSCKEALREVDRLLKEGFAWVVDADLQGDFDSIPHDRLIALVAARTAIRGTGRSCRCSK